MAKLFKWIGGYLGLVLGGPLGALAGFVVGSLVDNAMDSDVQPVDGNDPQGNNSYGNGSQRQAYANKERDTFRFALLVLASYIIRADGKVMHSEMELVRAWLRNNFGVDAQIDGERILNELFKKQKELGADEYKSAVMDSCRQLSQIMTYEQRLQLLNFLMMIAKADGRVVIEEERALRECGMAMGIMAADIDSILNLNEGGTNLDAAYRVLGVSPDATDAEVKAAFRRMALKNHPDKVATLGEDVRKAAEKKFQEINAAKELIWKARGMK
jgi:DnaJ like chaperone protein